MSRRAFSYRRDLLHRSQLGAFVAWASRNGYVVHSTPEKAVYEVARLELYDPAGNHPHIVIYRRVSGEHLTLCEDGVRLVHRWLDARRAA